MGRSLCCFACLDRMLKQELTGRVGGADSDSDDDKKKKKKKGKKKKKSGKESKHSKKKHKHKHKKDKGREKSLGPDGSDSGSDSDSDSSGKGKHSMKHRKHHKGDKVGPSQCVSCGRHSSDCVWVWPSEGISPVARLRLHLWLFLKGCQEACRRGSG